MEYMEYSLNAERADGITDPAYPKKVDAFATWCRAQPEVMHVQAFSDVMKKLNEAMNGGDPSRYRLPDSPELAAQYLLLYELSIPFGRDHNNRIDIGKSATRMTVTLDRLNSEQQRKLDARATDWLEENAPELAAEASGIRLVFAHTVIQNVKGLLYGTVAAMVLHFVPAHRNFRKPSHRSYQPGAQPDPRRPPLWWSGCSVCWWRSPSVSY